MAKIQSNLSRDAGLLNEMADVLGVDLIDRAMAGKINEAQLREAVANCAQCHFPTGCERWLNAHRNGATAPPIFCGNNDLWDLLDQDG